MAIEQRAEPAPRPLLACALALLAGGLIGAGMPLPPLVWALVAAGAIGVCVGARGHGRAVLTAGLLALGAVQAVRAGAGMQRAGAPLPPAVEGRWEPLSRDGRSTRGRLVGAPQGTPLLAAPTGSLRAGERVRLLRIAEPAQAARGPVPAPGSPVASVRVHPDELVRLAPPRGWIGALRERLGERCDRLGDEHVAGLARALLVGDRSGLDPRLADAFTRTGVRHLLAVSGLHVGLFAALLAGPAAWLATRLGRGSRASRRDLARALTALGLAAFAPLAGGAPPVRRAALAAAVALLAPLVPARGGGVEGRALDGLSVWSAALTLELAVDPMAALGVGVQLSYAATLGLILGTRPLERWLAGQLPAAEPRLDRSAAGRWTTTLGKRAGGWVRTAIAASCTATLATLPVVWGRFGEWSPYGVLLTPLALLGLAWLLPAGWIALLAPERLGPLLVEPVARGLVGLVTWTDDLPGTPWALPERPMALLVAGTALALAGLRAGPWLRRAAAVGWAALLLPWSPEPLGLELVALDVGHGTALALRAPGAGAWVFDAGSRDRTGVGPRALGPLLARWDPGRVAVVLSHGQVDHASGLGWLVERRPPWLWAGALPAPLGERLPHTTRRLDATAGRVALPLPRACGSLSLALLRGAALPGNEGSRSLLVAWEGRRALLSGDAEQEGLRTLLERGDLCGPLEILLAPHHGSHTPWLGPLLEATRPREVWVSAPRRPPIAEELDRLRLVLRVTGLEGPLLATWSPRDRIAAAGTRIASSRNEPEPVPAPGAGSTLGIDGLRRGKGGRGQEPGGTPARPPSPGPGPATPARGAPLPHDLPGGHPMTSTSRAALALLALAALAPTPRARAQDEGTRQEPADEARELDRLLTLADGRVIRARARLSGDAWEVRTAAGWQALPSGSVERVRSEREVLADAKRLAREVPRDDVDRRVALADWMLRQGLAAEGLEQLDRVLRSDPDHALALGLLAGPPQPLGLTALAVEDPQELLRAAAGAPPSVRELAIQRLDEIAGDGAREVLQEALESHSVRLRAFAAVALRRLYPGEEVRPLAVRSILDGSEDVRREASLSLRAVGEPAVILPAVRALESSHEAVRENAIEALGVMGYPAAVPPLIARLSAVQGAAMGQAAPRANLFVGRQLAYIQDFDVEVAQGAAIADPVVNTLTEGSVLDVRVVGVHIFTTAVETRRIRRSLAQLVGEERSARGWLEWWETHQDEYAAPATGRDGGRPVTGG